MSEGLEQAGEPVVEPAIGARRTSPLSVAVSAVSGLRNAVFPALAAAFGTGISGSGLYIGMGVAALIFVAAGIFSLLNWMRLTFTIGAQDIRVESGILSRAARSVPFERIQDVSLEQSLIPRLLGLVSVKFETGAGGGEDLSLTYLTEDEGEELRQLVRERREEEVTSAVREGAEGAKAALDSGGEEGEVIFAMGPGRLFTFGLFEFSLAVFAVLFGLLQYSDNVFGIDAFDVRVWWGWVEDQSSVISGASRGVQVLSAIGGLIGLLVVGSATGMVRVFAREWGFLLERTARGFRRRRGLFTRTDVVMPIHRVQGVRIGTGWARYRFGWHRLSFVSLAQDMGASNHDVAPFARMDEIEPIMQIAGFTMPQEDAEWHRATSNYLIDSAIWSSGFFFVLAAVLGVVFGMRVPEWQGVAVGIPLILAGVNILGTFIGWRFKRHTIDARQVAAGAGLLSPRMKIARRVKLHSVEIAQGPIARLRGYATLHLGQAGGVFAIPGIPVERARELRREVLESMVATDFSQLEKA